MRKQYHFRESANGYFAWDVHRLIELSKALEIVQISIQAISETDENYWFGGTNDLPSCRKLVEHMKLVNETDLRFPILLCAEGRLMDGMHRVARALLEGRETINSVQFQATPEPDYVDVVPDDLTY